MMKHSIAFAILLAIGSPVNAQDANNRQHDVTTCAAFYGLMAKGAAKSGDDALAELMTTSANLAMGLAWGIASTMNMETNTVIERYEMAVASMMSDMAGNWNNTSIIIEKYGIKCQDVVNAGPQR